MSKIYVENLSSHFTPIYDSDGEGSINELILKVNKELNPRDAYRIRDADRASHTVENLSGKQIKQLRASLAKERSRLQKMIVAINSTLEYVNEVIDSPVDIGLEDDDTLLPEEEDE